MPKAGLFAAAYRDRVVRIVLRAGLARAMAHLPLGIIYSGSWDKVYQELNVDYKGHHFADNNTRSEGMALRLRGTRINHTRAGTWLETKNLFPYFEAVYAPFVDGHLNPIFSKKFLMLLT
ncbi:MAG: hypothetical protein WC612_05180 [Bdellovibrionales bacterium]|jgi:hypothetical protein